MDDINQVGTLPPPDTRTTDELIRECLIVQSKTFEQTTWLCRIVSAMIQTMPPQMRPVLTEDM